jgi:(p)ppGpp synthase/HD superfamily hydrolase
MKTATKIAYAQSNIQLFNQLIASDYSENEIACIVDAYKLVMNLFTGVFRSSGKTFIAHLIGTASILVDLKAPVEIVSAGLLHAAYASGEFGNGTRGISPAKRSQVKRVVGQKVEEYIYTYTLWPEEDDPLVSVVEYVNALTPLEKDVLLIRLANHLEEYVDLGMLYSGHGRQNKYIKDKNYISVELAQILGFPNLAGELKTVFDEAYSATIPPVLANITNHNGSYLLSPKTHQKRLSVTLYCWLVRIRSGIARRLRKK